MSSIPPVVGLLLAKITSSDQDIGCGWAVRLFLCIYILLLIIHDCQLSNPNRRISLSKRTACHLRPNWRVMCTPPLHSGMERGDAGMHISLLSVIFSSSELKRENLGLHSSFSPPIQEIQFLHFAYSHPNVYPIVHKGQDEYFILVRSLVASVQQQATIALSLLDLHTSNV